MTVSSIESTPNPSSFLLRLTSPLEGLEELGKLRGKSFYGGKGSSSGADVFPPAVAALLQIDGVESVYAMSDAVTVSKHPSSPWETILPPAVEALGGGNDESVLLLGLLSATSSASAGRAAQEATSSSSSSSTGQVRIRMQISNRLPIQIEAIGYRGTAKRVKLPDRFGDAMSKAMEDKEKDFFASRRWLDRGMRYPTDLVFEDSGKDVDEEERERLEMESALQAEVEEVEAAYPPHRLDVIVSGGGRGSKRRQRSQSSSSDVDELDLEDVVVLCDEAEDGDDLALDALVRFVRSGNGDLAARRNAVAYLGGTAGRCADAVLSAVVFALQNEPNPILRRTAGDALSDLGDVRAVPAGIEALGDRSKLVRWRAARVLGELAETDEALGALRQAGLDEEAFEVGFEMKDAIRKVEARQAATAEAAARGGLGKDGSGVPKTGPVWKQIQEGSSSSSGSR